MSKLSAIKGAILILAMFAAIIIACIVISVASKVANNDEGALDQTSTTANEYIADSIDDETDNQELYAPETVVPKSGTWVDIDNDIIPLTFGRGYFYDVDNVYGEMFTSTYRKTYAYEISTNSENEDDCNDTYNTADLQKKYKLLRFDLAHSEDAPEDSVSVKIYEGRISSKKLLLEAKCNPGKQDKTYTLDVSNVSSLTILYTTTDWGASTVLTNGFQLQVK